MVACAICGKPAECLGQYDTMEVPAYACGECCGHGNEDGWCWLLQEIPENVGAIQTEINQLYDKLAEVDQEAFE